MAFLLIIGAKSDIAKALARVYSKNGFDLYLAARRVNELTQFAQDIRIRTQRKVELLELDILDTNSHHALYYGLKEKPLGVISAVGYLGDQKRAEMDFREARIIIETNYTGVVSLLNIIANDFERRRQGFIIAISSVAGERGRKANYIYGSAKAALTAYLSGLRNRLFDSGVHIMTVLPGFVATKMTKHLELPEKLTAQPDEVAWAIYRAQQKGRDVVYVKPIWKLIMFIIKIIPEGLFKRLSI